MSKPVANVALKTALFSTQKHQQQIAKAARIDPQKLSHVIHGRRSFDEHERRRLIAALARYGVTTTEAELFPEGEAVSA